MNDNTQCTCPSGDGSLRWPCPTHAPIVAKPRVRMIRPGCWECCGLGSRMYGNTPGAAVTAWQVRIAARAAWESREAELSAYPKPIRYVVKMRD